MTTRVVSRGYIDVASLAELRAVAARSQEPEATLRGRIQLDPREFPAIECYVLVDGADVVSQGGPVRMYVRAGARLRGSNLGYVSVHDEGVADLTACGGVEVHGGRARVRRCGHVQARAGVVEGVDDAATPGNQANRIILSAAARGSVRGRALAQLGDGSPELEAFDEVRVERTASYFTGVLRAHDRVRVTWSGHCYDRGRIFADGAAVVQLELPAQASFTVEARGGATVQVRGAGAVEVTLGERATAEVGSGAVVHAHDRACVVAAGNAVVVLHGHATVDERGYDVRVRRS